MAHSYALTDSSRLVGATRLKDKRPGPSHGSTINLFEQRERSFVARVLQQRSRYIFSREIGLAALLEDTGEALKRGPIIWLQLKCALKKRLGEVEVPRFRFVSCLGTTTGPPTLEQGPLQSKTPSLRRQSPC